MRAPIGGCASMVTSPPAENRTLSSPVAWPKAARGRQSAMLKLGDAGFRRHDKLMREA